ncbi:GNAT family N-acetyltransferase [Gulosibacter faecalis]|uniref:GNAT family N-acetyltransferase n=1 Tax=Gulosibacter faecalis TaxID=272240 RepID=A0ABW5UUQ5_9MICO|nr:GNAT family N-acetyltransferase [Gulosibacter faecalis]
MANASSLDAGSMLSGTLTGRRLSSDAELGQAAELYTRVFRYEAKRITLNPLLIQAIIRNGGSAVGVYDGDRIVGFAYGFAGRDAAGRDFHYSQAAVVDADYQGRGAGRALKLLQREVALEWGHERMRWTFDPLVARNGHFNLDSLGATGLEFHTDYYDRPGTDRVMVEWDLTAATGGANRAATAATPVLDARDWGDTCDAGDGATWIAVPTTAPEPGSDERGRIAARLRDSLATVTHSGRVLVSCRRVSEATAGYLAVPSVVSTTTDEAVSA